MREDFYVHRWFMHVFDMAGDQIETCTENMIKALRWRRDENVRGMPNHLSTNSRTNIWSSLVSCQFQLDPPCKHIAN